MEITYGIGLAVSTRLLVAEPLDAPEQGAGWPAAWGAEQTLGLENS
ncbi:hypothetical protein [Kitasatospora sp. NPDC058190]